MPRTRPRITTAETKDNRARLLQLKEKGIAAGEPGHLPANPDRLILQQIDRELARVYALPNGEVAVVVLAKLTILRSGVMILDQQMTIPWDEWPLDLSSPREHRYFQNLIQGLPTYPPFLLNDLLAQRDLPLRRCQHEGVIIATGWTSIPATYPDETLVSMELSLKDDQDNETDFEFRGRVDRSFIRTYERQLQERRAAAPLHKREGVFGPTLGESDRPSISPEPQVATERDETGASKTSGAERSGSRTRELHRDTIQ